MEKMISIEKFADNNNVSVDVVIKNFGLIQGAYKENGVYMIPESSRYPYFLHNDKIETREDKVLVILRAINKYKYVDEDTVKLPKYSFDIIVKELLENGYLVVNGCDNPYGLNRYDPTNRTTEILKRRREQAIKEIANIAGTTVGTAIGAGVAAYKNLTM